MGRIAAKPRSRPSQSCSISDNPSRAEILADRRDVPTTNGVITRKKINASQHPLTVCLQCQCRRRSSSNASSATNSKKNRKNRPGSKRVRLSLTSEISMRAIAALSEAPNPRNSTPSLPKISLSRPALLRFSATGCILRCDQCVMPNRF
jgi:hypothetical protein